MSDIKVEPPSREPSAVVESVEVKAEAGEAGAGEAGTGEAGAGEAGAGEAGTGEASARTGEEAVHPATVVREEEEEAVHPATGVREEEADTGDARDVAVSPVAANPPAANPVAVNPPDTGDARDVAINPATGASAAVHLGLVGRAGEDYSRYVPNNYLPNAEGVGPTDYGRPCPVHPWRPQDQVSWTIATVTQIFDVPAMQQAHSLQWFMYWYARPAYRLAVIWVCFERAVHGKQNVVLTFDLMNPRGRWRAADLEMAGPPRRMTDFEAGPDGYHLGRFRVRLRSDGGPGGHTVQAFRLRDLFGKGEEAAGITLGWVVRMLVERGMDQFCMGYLSNHPSFTGPVSLGSRDWITQVLYILERGLTVRCITPRILDIIPPLPPFTVREDVDRDRWVLERQSLFQRGIYHALGYLFESPSRYPRRNPVAGGVFYGLPSWGRRAPTPSGMPYLTLQGT